VDEQLDIFFGMLIEAIENVEEEYFITSYHNIPFQDDIRRAVRDRLLRYNEGMVYKPGERIFAYELYYQLRKLLDSQRRHQPDFYQHCWLQAEVKKHQMFSILERMKNVNRLSGSFVPDFLIHTPGSDDVNAYVIELKASFNFDFQNVLWDLTKMSQFLSRYHYERAVFISIFHSLGTVRENFTQQNSLDKLREFISIDISKKIYIITKENYNRKVEYTTLSEIIYNNV
jgi:hypothetical protein